MASASTLRRRPLWIGGWLLFLLPLPLALKAVISLWRGEFVGLVAGAFAFLVLLLGAWLMRQGLAQAKRRPTGSGFPFKTAGSAVVAIGTALTALIAGHNPLIAGGFGLGALAGCYLSYGFDRRLKLSNDKDVATALEEAYGKLEQLEAAGKRIGSREFKDRLGRIIDWGEKILARIQEDPEDFRRARKFLNVYLDGARQVTDKYARTHGEAESAELEENFRTLLADMETVCEEQYQRLLDDDMVDLDVQIEVLTTRLKREGVV